MGLPFYFYFIVHYFVNACQFFRNFNKRLLQEKVVKLDSKMYSNLFVQEIDKTLLKVCLNVIRKAMQIFEI